MPDSFAPENVWLRDRDPKKRQAGSWSGWRKTLVSVQVLMNLCYCTFIEQSRACFFFEMKLKKEVTNLYNKKTPRTLMLEMITRSGKRWMCFFWQCVTFVLTKWVPVQDDFPRVCVLPEKNSICLIALNLREYVPIWDVFGVMYIVCFFLSFNVSNLRNHSLKAWCPACSANVWQGSFFISKLIFSVPKSSPETSHPWARLMTWACGFASSQGHKYRNTWWTDGTLQLDHSNEKTRCQARRGPENQGVKLRIGSQNVTTSYFFRSSNLCPTCVMLKWIKTTFFSSCAAILILSLFYWYDAGLCAP